MNVETLTAWRPQALSLARIVAALLYFEHGTQKLLGFPPSDGAIEAFSLSWFSGIIEIVGGALLIVGFQTRAVAFVLSGHMAFAYWIGHAPRGFFPVDNGGDAAILFCFIFLYFVFAGPGPWSVDAALRRRR